MSVCKECGVTENLCNHHVSYEPEITKVLCRSCHMKEHQKPGVPSYPYHSANHKRVLISFEEEVIDKLDEKAGQYGITRNLYVVQICRKHLGFPSVIREDA